MEFSKTVDIRFSLKNIKDTCTAIDDACGATGSLKEQVTVSCDQERQFLLSVLDRISDFLKANDVDAENADKLEKELEKALWNAEEEMKRHDSDCAARYKTKNSAYNQYVSLRSKSSADSPGSVEAAQAAFAAYERADNAYNAACEARESCRKRIESIKSAQDELFGIKRQIQDDYMRLKKEEDLFKSLIDDLEHAYERFAGKCRRVLNTLETNLENARAAYGCATDVMRSIGEINGEESPKSSEVQFNSIYEIQRNAEHAAYINESQRELEQRIKRSVEDASKQIVDNIMRSSENLMQNIAKATNKELEKSEERVRAMMDLVRNLQHYYDVLG